MKIGELTPVNWTAVCDFVDHSSAASLFHHPAWRTVVQDTSSAEVDYLIAEQDGCIAGVFPLAYSKTILFGRRAISLPFAVEAGVICQDEEALAPLLTEARKRCVAKNIRSLLLKNSLPLKPELIEKFALSLDPTNVTFCRQINGTAEERLAAIPRKQRAVIRKALASGLYIESGFEHLDLFYALYAQSVHRLGTPVFPKQLFKAILSQFGDQSLLWIVRNSDQEPIAGLMSFVFKDRIMPYYAAATDGSATYHAHNLMYFELMNWAANQGLALFDFGKSRVGSGHAAYKKNWGFEAKPLHYYVMGLKDGARIPKAGRGGYGLLSKLWTHLPLRVANTLGPSIARHLG